MANCIICYVIMTPKGIFTYFRISSTFRPVEKFIWGFKTILVAPNLNEDVINVFQCPWSDFMCFIKQVGRGPGNIKRVSRKTVTEQVIRSCSY